MDSLAGRGAARRVLRALGDSIVRSVPGRTPPLAPTLGAIIAPKAHLHPGVSPPTQSPIREAYACHDHAYALQSDR